MAKDRLHQLAASLEKDLPNSEKWFWEKWRYFGFHRPDELSNQPFLDTYIADVINPKLRYVIEIDGAIHNTSSQVLRDRAKDRFYEANGYSVYRIRAYDLHALLRVAVALKKRFPES